MASDTKEEAQNFVAEGVLEAGEKVLRFGAILN